MKSLTKVLVGAGVVTAVGSGVILVASKKIVGKAKGFAKKQELKKFVTEDMSDNQLFVSLIDQLDNQEIFELTDLIKKAKVRQKQIHLKNEAHSLKEEVKKKLVRFLDMMPIK